jgi:hypothetical protein
MDEWSGMRVRPFMHEEYVNSIHRLLLMHALYAFIF